LVRFHVTHFLVFSPRLLMLPLAVLHFTAGKARENRFYICALPMRERTNPEIKFQSGKISRVCVTNFTASYLENQQSSLIEAAELMYLIFK
jgi:hypothetical protein